MTFLIIYLVSIFTCIFLLQLGKILKFWKLKPEDFFFSIFPVMSSILAIGLIFRFVWLIMEAIAHEFFNDEA